MTYRFSYQNQVSYKKIFGLFWMKIFHGKNI